MMDASSTHFGRLWSMLLLQTDLHHPSDGELDVRYLGLNSPYSTRHRLTKTSHTVKMHIIKCGAVLYIFLFMYIKD